MPILNASDWTIFTHVYSWLTSYFFNFLDRLLLRDSLDIIIHLSCLEKGCGNDYTCSNVINRAFGERSWPCFKIFVINCWIKNANSQKLFDFSILLSIKKKFKFPDLFVFWDDTWDYIFLRHGDDSCKAEIERRWLTLFVFGKAFTLRDKWLIWLSATFISNQLAKAITSDNYCCVSLLSLNMTHMFSCLRICRLSTSILSTSIKHYLYSLVVIFIL